MKTSWNNQYEKEVNTYCNLQEFKNWLHENIINEVLFKRALICEEDDIYIAVDFSIYLSVVKYYRKKWNIKKDENINILCFS